MQHYTVQEWHYCQYEVNSTHLRGVFTTPEEAQAFARAIATKAKENGNYKLAKDASEVYGHREGFSVSVTQWDGKANIELSDIAYKRIYN